MRLQETNHSYYCEAYSEKCNTSKYDSWEDFKCINYNFEPFITGNKQFTEDDKARLFNDILKYYCI